MSDGFNSAFLIWIAVKILAEGVFFISYDNDGIETARLQLYTLEYLVFPVTGITSVVVVDKSSDRFKELTTIGVASSSLSLKFFYHIGCILEKHNIVDRHIYNSILNIHIPLIG